MTKHVIFIQGGGEGAYDADQKLAANLQASLGPEYHVHYPRMPDEGRPDYEAWAAQINADLAARNGDIIIVGHSLGASFVLKYLSEEIPSASIKGLFLIAAPYWGTEDWEVDEYTLQEGFESRLPSIQRIYLYHSRDDVWVPFSHLALYAQRLPHAIIREFDERGHQFNNDLSEVAQDIINEKGGLS